MIDTFLLVLRTRVRARRHIEDGLPQWMVTPRAYPNRRLREPFRAPKKVHRQIRQPVRQGNTLLVRQFGCVRPWLWFPYLFPSLQPLKRGDVYLAARSHLKAGAAASPHQPVRAGHRLRDGWRGYAKQLRAKAATHHVLGRAAHSSPLASVPRWLATGIGQPVGHHSLDGDPVCTLRHGARGTTSECVWVSICGHAPRSISKSLGNNSVCCRLGGLPLRQRPASPRCATALWVYVWV